MEWLNEKEERIYNLGFLIGFWVGEGSISATEHMAARKVIHRNKKTSLYYYNNRYFGITFSQKEKSVLLNIQEILQDFNIKSKIVEKNEKHRKNLCYTMYLQRSEFDKMLVLLTNYPLYSEKREKEVLHFEKQWVGMIRKKDGV